ncbi:MAG: hypothetical protein ACXWQO_19990 [Bdellovibrionota bacterium]
MKIFASIDFIVFGIFLIFLPAFIEEVQYASPEGIEVNFWRLPYLVMYYLGACMLCSGVGLLRKKAWAKWIGGAAAFAVSIPILLSAVGQIVEAMKAGSTNSSDLVLLGVRVVFRAVLGAYWLYVGRRLWSQS